MRRAVMTAERVSVLSGILVVMAVTLPRYIAAAQQQRLILLSGAFVLVLGVTLASWRLLSEQARGRLPGLLGRLSVAMLGSCALIAVWQVVQGGIASLAWISHGATLGLLIHALLVGWRRPPA